MIKYNLQFFAEGGESDDQSEVGSNTTNNAGDDSNNTQDQIDPQAFADIISEKDKQIEQLQKDVAELKKSNANLIVKVNSQSKPEQKLSFEENLLNMAGAKPRKE